ARPNMTSEVSWIRICRVDDIADLVGEGEHSSVLDGSISEGIEPDIPPYKSRGDAVGRGKFRGVSISGGLLGGERLPQSVHGALPDFAHKFLDIVNRNPTRRQPAGAINIGMRHRSAWIELEREGFRHPVLAEFFGQRRVISLDGVGEAVEQAVGAFEYSAWTDEARACHQGGA